MKEELEATLNGIEVINDYEIFGLKFYEAKYDEKDLILVECGMGKVNAARCAQILIDNLKADCIINIGVAGGISQDLNICDLVIADKLVQHDFDLRPLNFERGFIPNVGMYVPCDEYLINLAKDIKVKRKTFVGTIASGDIFITDEVMAKKINDKFNALCVEMEGASIAQVCFLAHIPCLVIRAISDSPNRENNNITFEEFLEESSSSAADFLKQLIHKID